MISHFNSLTLLCGLPVVVHTIVVESVMSVCLSVTFPRELKGLHHPLRSIEALVTLHNATTMLCHCFHDIIWWSLLFVLYLVSKLNLFSP